jgi:D-beta-D-heptose 7-phosphate kinase/D-beta-D-heptose 1-phosphate adenosyltransferase
MSRLLDALAAWKPFRVTVVGDYMLDEMIFGNVDRLANDAPVPVLHVQRTEHRPGGSANVCLNLAALKASVLAVGVVGDDLAGDALRVSLSEQGVSVDGLLTDADRPTTTKQNLIGLAQHRHAQKMFRVDRESREPIHPRLVQKLLDAIEAQLEVTDVICLEDYAKGVLTEELCQGVIAMAKRRSVPVLVDPASITDYARYRGASAITPNRNEAEKAAGMTRPDGAPAEAYAKVAERLQQIHDFQAVVITLDKSGALLLEQGQEARTVPTVARQVYDVTGAGDMVLAALAAARANALDWSDSVRFANAAAGLEVEHFGVVPIPIEHIHRDLLVREKATRGKLRTLGELVVEVEAIRKAAGHHSPRRPKVVLANGCFDVLHAGHVSLLRRAAALGDYLIVAVNADASVKRLKGPTRPIYPIADRAQLLGELECVGAVVVFDEDTPEQVIHAVKPDVLVKGAQYKLEDIPGAKFVTDHGGTVELLDVIEGRSTTGTVEKIKASAAS